MPHRFACLAGALLLCVANAGAAALPSIALLTEEYAPFNWTDKASGRVTGVSTEVVAEMMRRAGRETSGPVVVPWARGLAVASGTAHTCLYTAARVPEREASYQWIGPIGHTEWVLFARAADKIVLRKLDDARSYTIGTYIGDASVSYLRERHFKLDVTSSDRANPSKLQLRRIDLWSVMRLPGLNLLRELKIGDLEPVLTFTQADMYLACNRDMERTEATRLNDTLRQMYRDGTVRAIYTRFGYGKEAPAIEPAR